MPSLLALLCLGLSVGIRILVNAGTDPRPILWAEPGSVVLWSTPVTLWCQGNVGAKQFRLIKTEISPLWENYSTLQPGDKAKFSVPFMTGAYAGTYKCSYLSHASWSESSDPLELVVTGLHSKPSLSAFPNPVVASGETVTLQCDSWVGFDTFVLTQEGDLETHRKLGSKRLSSGGRQALFKVVRVAPDRRWSFRCYGLFSDTPQQWSHPSNPLQLLVSGASRRPSLLSLQGQIVSPGKTLILQCHSKDAYDTFALYKEKSRDITQHPGHRAKDRLSLANFILGHVSAFHGGRYRCIGRNGFTSLWSEPSDPIDIFVAEQLSYTPTLSVEPGPSVSPGDNVTLLCQSSGWMNTFLLTKKGAADPQQRVKVDKTEEITQAQFSFDPVTSALNGTYRCYSSNSFNPYRLSRPSVPLHLWVSGPAGDSRTMSTAVWVSLWGSIQGKIKIADQRCAKEGDRKEKGTDREVLSPGTCKGMRTWQAPFRFLCDLPGTQGKGMKPPASESRAPVTSFTPCPSLIGYSGPRYLEFPVREELADGLTLKQFLFRPLS